jgi:hypothetical protein
MAADIASVIFDVKEVILDQLMIFRLGNDIFSRRPTLLRGVSVDYFHGTPEQQVYNYDQENARDDYPQTELLQCAEHAQP